MVTGLRHYVGGDGIEVLRGSSASSRWRQGRGCIGHITCLGLTLPSPLISQPTNTLQSKRTAFPDRCRRPSGSCPAVLRPLSSETVAAPGTRRRCWLSTTIGWRVGSRSEARCYPRCGSSSLGRWAHRVYVCVYLWMGRWRVGVRKCGAHCADIFAICVCVCVYVCWSELIYEILETV